MCGISGSSADPDGRQTAEMVSRMIHRGPDDSGVHVDSEHGVAIGARRLSIIDVAGGHQPLSNEDGTIWAVLNGEIYNHPRLREELAAGGHRFASLTDTEVLVHLYEEYGEGLVHALEGMYAFAIWDSKQGVMLLARDRFGEKPLFYEHDGGEFAFASELSALRGTEARGELESTAIDALLTLGYVPGPLSVVRDVRQLPAAHTLRWDVSERRPRIARYWQMPIAVHGPAGQTPMVDLIDETEDLLDRSCRTRLIADVPVGVFLSGGLDSTLVAALSRRHASTLRTFTVTYEDGAVGEDAPARATARLLGSEHHEFRLTADWVATHVPRFLSSIDQPVADPAYVALAAISKHARDHVTVAVGGEGADELFFGYPRYRWLDRAEQLERVVPPAFGATLARAARRAGKGRTRRLAEVMEPATVFDRHLSWVTDGRLGERNGLYGPALHDRRDGATLRRLLFDRWPSLGSPAGATASFDQQLYLCDDILQKADRASMAASLEMRTPFLDRTLAEFSATVAPDVHMGTRGKELLRGVLQRVLPSAGRGRTKVAFRVPLTDWLAGPLATTTHDHLIEGALVRDGWIDRTAAGALLARLASGDAAAAGTVWPLLCVGAWMDARA